MMTAMTVLFAASCSKEQIDNTVPMGEQVTVSLTADLSAIESRAIADGLSVNEVAWAIYLHDAATPLPEMHGVLPINSKQGTLEVRLVTGKSYDIALFAYYSENPATAQTLTIDGGVANPAYYSVDWNNKAISVLYPDGTIANDTDKRDCFFHVEKKLFVEGPVAKTFTLTRPLAQLNFGATLADTTAAAEAGLVVSYSQLVASTYTKFNMFTGECLDAQPVEYTFEKNIVPQQVLEVNNTNYTYLGTAYLLVNEKMIQDVQLTIYSQNEEINTLSYNNVPFQRNYRTNILGSLLTNPVDVTIVVDDTFKKPDYLAKHWDGTTKAITPDADGVYTVAEAGELAWIAEQVNSGANNFEGKKIVVSDSVKVIDLYSTNGYVWTPIGNKANAFKGSFNGNGVLIRNMAVKCSEFAGLFGNVLSAEGITNVCLENVTIEANHYAGAVAGYAYANIENCSVDRLSLIVTPNEVATREAAYDNGDKVGGIVGYVGESNYKLSGNVVKNATIQAYRDLGGIAGAAYIATCENNTVENAKLTVDQTVNSYGEKDANLGEIIGRVLGGELGQNTVKEVELVWNPKTLKPTTPINKITAAGTYEVKGIVSAVGSSAYFISDGTAALMVYGSNHKRVIGELVRIEGKVSRYNGYNTNVWQIIPTSTLVISEGNTPAYNPTALTAAEVDALVGQTATSTEVQFTGVVVQNGSYLNIKIDGAEKQASLYYIKVADYEKYIGANVTVKGYITGTNNYLNVLPYEVIDNKKESEWGIVGDLNNWGATPDITMYTYGDGIMFAKGVEIAEGQGFKIRANNKWDDTKNYGTSDPKVYINMEQPVFTGGGSGNIIPTEGGKFDIYFDLGNKKVYVMEVGEAMADALPYEKFEEPIHDNDTWRIVGSFNGWNAADDNYLMTLSDDHKWATIVAEFDDKSELKFVANGSWTKNFGNGVTVELGKEYAGYQDGGNIIVPAGNYKISLSMCDGRFKFEEGVTEVTKTITFDDKAKRTVLTTSQQVWVENGITITNDKGSSSSNVADYSKPARFYKSSKLTVATGGEIQSIVFDCNSASYATALKSAIPAASGTITVSSDKVTVVLAKPASSFVIANLSGGQVRMDSITVTWLE